MKLDRQAAFTGTKDVSEALKFPVAPLEAYLTAKVAGFAGPLTVRQFKGGQSNPTYFLQTPSRCYVLRRKPPGKLLPSAHAIDREFTVMRALHGSAGGPLSWRCRHLLRYLRKYGIGASLERLLRVD